MLKRILNKVRELFKRPTDVHYTSVPLLETLARLLTLEKIVSEVCQSIPAGADAAKQIPSLPFVYLRDGAHSELFRGRGLGTGDVRSRHRGNGRLREHSNVKAWLYTILRNIRLSQVRKRATSPKLVELDAYEDAADLTSSHRQQAKTQKGRRSAIQNLLN